MMNSILTDKKGNLKRQRCNTTIEKLRKGREMFKDSTSVVEKILNLSPEGVGETRQFFTIF